jgi:hypothetical protein
MSEHPPVYDATRVDEHRQFWRDRSTVVMGRKHLDSVLAAWRALALQEGRCDKTSFAI